MTVFAHVVPLAVAAWQIVLEEDEVPLGQPFLRGERLADPGEGAYVFVTHDQGAVAQRQPILRHVRATDARHLHLHQRRVVGYRRKVELAQLRRRWSDLYCSQDFFTQSRTSSGEIGL